MVTNSKRSEHKSCGCAVCTRGAGTAHGQTVHRQVNRAIRHKTKQQLAEVVNRDADQLEEFVSVIAGTPYTD